MCLYPYKVCPVCVKLRNVAVQRVVIAGHSDMVCFVIFSAVWKTAGSVFRNFFVISGRAAALRKKVTQSSKYVAALHRGCSAGGGSAVFLLLRCFCYLRIIHSGMLCGKTQQRYCEKNTPPRPCDGHVAGRYLTDTTRYLCAAAVTRS